ncbi:hypothetical protein EEL30_07485 [Brevibacillus laterosporus]|uniref:Uncharacterized protein n=1 Tax=Brevibacillus laterosporus TaxID=1465 RepID=A0A518V5D9_BRELA|nr:hypothetical protein EEL30_07485 [Brevibacillus laterosporus]
MALIWGDSNPLIDCTSYQTAQPKENKTEIAYNQKLTHKVVYQSLKDSTGLKKRDVQLASKTLMI